LVEIVVLERGWVTISANFRGKGASPTNDYWHQKTRVPGLSYGDKKCGKFQPAEYGAPTLQTDGTATAYSERGRKFTFAKTDATNMNDNLLTLRKCYLQ